MLELIFGYPKDAVKDSDVLFSETFKREWLLDSDVKRYVKMIDRDIIDDSVIVYNEYGDLIGPDLFSSGLKSIIMYKFLDDIMIPLEFMGDNCFDLLSEISLNKRVRTCSSNSRRLFNHGFKEVFIVNNNKIVKSQRELLLEYVKIEEDFYGEYDYFNRGWSDEW